MANPRQRRKARSSTHRAVKQSRKSASKLMRKHPPIKGPKELQEAWDDHKTVRQNYAALGLAHSLTPGERARRDNEDAAEGESVEEEQHGDKSDGAAEKRTGTALPRGYGRIVRDADGNVVDVEMGEEEERSTAAGVGDEDVLVPRVGEGDWLLNDGDQDGEKGIVHALEDRVANGKRPSAASVRATSRAEHDYLAALKAAHGDDFESMARDRRRNGMQYSAGQLRRAMDKAKLIS